jgi:predicted metal-dependent hydrolase
MKNRLRDWALPRFDAWTARLGVHPDWWGVRSMKTKWGSCNADKRIIWLNSSLVKKPESMIDYVILHELAHLISSRHDQRFTAVLDREMPRWRNVRKELNALPLEAWID